MSMVAWRFFWRDLRAGELTLILLTLILAVAALSSVRFFVDRIESSLNQQARQFLASDLVISGGQNFFSDYRDIIRRFGLKHAQTVSFPSMAFSDTGGQLVNVKAVSAAYPLRGELETWIAGERRAGQGAPELGTVWVDERFLARLQVREGELVQLGSRHFRVAGQVMHEPDAALDLLNVMPRVLMNWQDVARSQLLDEGARAKFRLLLASDDAKKLQAAQTMLAARLKDSSLRLENVQDARPEIRTGLARAQQFLSLSSLLALILAAVALALSARRYVERHEAQVGVLRCLGATQRTIALLYAWQFICLAILGGVLGSALGFVGQWFLLSTFSAWLGDFVLESVPILPWVFGVLTGSLLLFSFFAPALLQLRNVAVMRVLRQESRPDRASFLVFSLGLLGLFVLTWWSLRDAKLSLLILGGALIFLVLASVLAFLLWRLAVFAVRALPFLLRHGIEHASRRTILNTLQTVVLSLGVMTILALAWMQNDLLSMWENSLPERAPNRFLLNVQPLQAEQLEKIFTRQSLDLPRWYPVIRGRWREQNGEKIAPENFADEANRQLAEREFNLTWTEHLPEENRIVSGAWWGDQLAAPQFSLEKGLAERLGIRLGDELAFEVAGEVFRAPVTSIREVNWTSFRANFFVIASPDVFKKLPSSLISSFHLPRSEEDIVTHILRDFPNVTMVDITHLLAELRVVLTKIVEALRYLLGFGLLTGVCVLWTAFYATREERIREAALLRILGASGTVILLVNAVELIFLGGLSGALGGVGATILLMFLRDWIFHLPWFWRWDLLASGAILGVIFSLVVGLPMLWRVLRVSPLWVLRRA